MSPASVLVYIHIPKCGGTSFRNMLARQLGRHHLNLYVDDTDFVYSESVLTDLLSDTGVWSLSSHFIYSFPPVLAGRPVYYATFLRHPVGQFLSYRNYICKVFRALKDSRLLARLPPRADELSSREFARWVLTESPPIAPFRENFTVNHLTKHVSNNISTTGPESRRSRLQAAQEILQEFLFVGITEELSVSFGRFVDVAVKRGFPLWHDSVPVDNAAREYTDDISWLNPEDEIGSLLLASMEEDLALYHWAKGFAATSRGSDVDDARRHSHTSYEAVCRQRAHLPLSF